MVNEWRSLQKQSGLRTGMPPPQGHCADLFLQLQAYRLHQCKRVAGAHDSGMQPVVKLKLAIFEAVLEVVVLRQFAYRLRDFSEGQIVCSHHSDGSPPHQPTNHEPRSVEPVSRIGSRKQLIKQE